ncbi:TIGR01777 family oxidoreductase [Cellulophaga baltica]|uniref:TIGR01777 family oxidoreductase n=1 Tax=Cellulophaga TaxID=104264 RepID=UPI001C0653B4|nr:MULTISPECIES: TIGR01777 family oxidoreductase [Cellulophaga]MBU2996883.1 TIGR01777 family oxidoreductase [Cellulophaga baltica]MDO6768280.1 TIGR01777 family oxidoreductase [Cellulophaga sp. 1_MG-2023]
MRVLITGATGLVGSAIVAICHKNNVAVNYLTTSKDKIETLDNYKGFYWNPDNSEIDANCFKGVTSIINLAGATISKRWTESYKKRILTSRINSLRVLNKGLQKIDASTIKSFVSASAIGIYPNSLSKLYNEDDELEIDGFLSEVVNAWEKEIDTFKNFDMTVAKVRIGLVLSNKGGALPEMVKPIKWYVGSPFGSGKQWQSWIHINDLARIFLFASENELEGVFNGVASNPVTNEKLVSETAKILGTSVFLPNVPASVLKIVLGDMSALLLDGQRVSNKKILSEGFDFKYQNVCNALSSFYGK